MKRIIFSFTILVFVVFSLLAEGGNREIFKEYKMVRRSMIEKLSREMDPVFMEKYAKFNRARRALIREILKKYPDIKKIKDEKQRKKAIRKKAIEFKRENNSYFLRYLKLRMDLDFYMMGKNKKMKELFLKIKDTKFFKIWL